MDVVVHLLVYLHDVERSAQPLEATARPRGLDGIRPILIIGLLTLVSPVASGQRRCQRWSR